MIENIFDIPQLRAKAVFIDPEPKVFRDENEVSPLRYGDYVIWPWGADNRMPYAILEMIEKDETVSTCLNFNSEIAYGSGISYEIPEESPDKPDINFFLEEVNLPEYFLGITSDFKHFGFAVSVIDIDRAANKIVGLYRLEAMYCRFGKANGSGHVNHIYYADWRKSGLRDENIEEIPVLPAYRSLSALQAMLAKSPKLSRMAIISRVPGVDSTYYPIPAYASIFKSRWYRIKRLIAKAKEAKLENSAPIKYHIEINARYWDNLFKREGITDPAKKRDRELEEKQKILDFLTGVENSGKVWFSSFYTTPDGNEMHDVKIIKVETDKEGGDYTTDIQEAVNMVCFTMRVHSNLVGSVPGKAQSNNSGSDKRELYTIAQALQKPYHDILLRVQKLIIRFNGWKGVTPVIPFIQLTTLDEHKDAKQVEL